MNLLNKLTIKNLKLNKKRTIVTIIGIMLSVALITAVSSIYTSAIKSLISFETYEKGDFHVAYFDVEKKDLNVFENNREIENLNITKNIGYAKIDSKNEYKPYAFVKAFTKSSLQNLSVKLVEGRLPNSPDEILIPTHLKTNGRLVLNVGDSITLDIGKRMSFIGNVELKQNNPYQSSQNEDIVDTISKTYKIVGITQRIATNIESYSSPGYTFITYMNDDDLTQKVDVYAKYNKEGVKNAYEITASILGVDEQLFTKYYKGLSSAEEIEQYTKEIKKAKYEIDINSYLIGLETNPLSMSSSGELAIVVAIVIFIIIITSVFCIKNSFDISITEKIKQYGMLKSIGATKKQIKRNVFYEATILGVIGIPLGILSGLLASYILIIVSNYFLRDSIAINLNLKFSFSLLCIVLAIVLGIITIYFSAFKSAKRASKISLIDSIRNSGGINIKARKLKVPTFVRKIFKMGGEIAYKNLKRNKKKYKTTIISIIVSVFVFIALASFMNMAFLAVDNELKITDYNLSLSSNQVDSLDKYISTTKLDNIEDYVMLREVGYEYNNRKFNPEYKEFLNLKVDKEENTQYVNIYALGKEPYQKFIKQLGLNYDEIYDKGILMDYMKVGKQDAKDKKMKYKTMHITNHKIGDVLTGKLNNNKDYEIKIGCITEIVPFGLKDINSIYLIVSEEEFAKIASENKMIDIFYKSNNPLKLQDDIEQILKEESYSINNIEENVKIMKNLYTLIGIFLYGFIIVISLIGITNIFNTITTNMELRRREFAMLKSIGMTKKEFKSMIELETFFMGVKALFYGILIGSILSYIIYYFLGKDSGIVYKLPILAIIISIIVVFTLVSLIMKYAINKINKQNTIETIRNENI